MADSVEALGVDLRTRVKKLGVKRRKHGGKSARSAFSHQKNKAFQKSHLKVGVNKCYVQE